MSRVRRFILDGKRPVLASFDAWACFLESDDRIVAQTQVEPGVHVSTVFMGIEPASDLLLAKDVVEPRVFETLIRGGPAAGRKWYSSTWEEAESRHKFAVIYVEAEQD